MNATFLRLMAAGLMITLGASCSTAYDAYGRPVSVVNPGMAALGLAAAGVAGFALANNNNNNRNRNWNRGHNRGHRGFYDNRRNCNPPLRNVRYW